MVAADDNASPHHGVEVVASTVATWLAAGRQVAVGRVAAIEGFSTWPSGEMVAVSDGGDTVGALLGAAGTAAVTDVAAGFLAASPAPVVSTSVSVHGEAVAAAGLSCGGQAEIVVQDAGQVPPALWNALADRQPVALLSGLDGAVAGHNLVLAGGRRSGALPAADLDELLGEAEGALRDGRSSFRRIGEHGARVLVETWVPKPRVVVVGAGDLAGALRDQAALLGWEVAATETPDAASERLDWAGASAAVVVLSHDPAVDTPVLAAALARQVGYVGALGSRRTQAGRAERLAAAGVDEGAIARIRGPIGLDLGGRSAPEVALAICAEIQAVRCGRQALALRDGTGPVAGRSPGTAAGAAR